MGAFANIVEIMAEMDIFQLFFPWLLVLAITYGILENSEVVSDDSSVNGVIAISMAFFTIGGAYVFLPQGILIRFASALVFGIFAIIGLVILLGLSGVDVGEMGDGGLEGNPAAAIAMLIFSVAFIGILIAETGLAQYFEGNLSDAWIFQEVLMPVLILIFLLLVILFVMGSEDDE